MRTNALFGGRHTTAITALLVAALIQGCSDTTDTLLEATDPDLIKPEDVRSPEGAVALLNGALGRFRTITAGGESTWLFGGLLVDEWSTSSTFVQNDETDQRTIQLNNSSVTGQLRALYRLRTSANEAIRALKEFRPDPSSALAELYFARGFAEMQLAQDFCNGIPLSDGSNPPEVTLGSPLTVLQVFEAAVASYDSALALSTGTDAQSVLVNRAARIGKARALLGLNQQAQAATLVNGIATTYAYQHTFAPSSGDNTLWGQGFSAKRYSVADSVEGNGRSILVRNAIPFGSANDPRLPVIDTRAAGQDGQTFTRTTALYGRSTAIDAVNGIDARLIEAEAALKASNPAGMLTILNALRATPPKVGDIQPAAMPALADPGTADGRLNLLFREKAFWTFSRGQRLGDLRRLVRQYGRTADNTFPVGIHYKGGNYGVDVNLPIVQAETNNPNFTGCIDRNA